jgi:hypothetical protein
MRTEILARIENINLTLLHENDSFGYKNGVSCNTIFRVVVPSIAYTHQHVKYASQSYLQGDGKFEQRFSATITRYFEVNYRLSIENFLHADISFFFISVIVDLFSAGTDLHFLTNRYA